MRVGGFCCPCRLWFSFFFFFFLGVSVVVLGIFTSCLGFIVCFRFMSFVSRFYMVVLYVPVILRIWSGDSWFCLSTASAASGCFQALN